MTKLSWIKRRQNLNDMTWEKYKQISTTWCLHSLNAAWILKSSENIRKIYKINNLINNDNMAWLKVRVQFICRSPKTLEKKVSRGRKQYTTMHFELKLFLAFVQIVTHQSTSNEISKLQTGANLDFVYLKLNIPVRYVLNKELRITLDKIS